MEHGRIGIFGGTREGRLLAEFCLEKGLPAAVSVVTSYGSGLLKEGKDLLVHTGRMDKEEMKQWIKDSRIFQVIDATHPYAQEASVQIRQACEEAEIPCFRLVRQESVPFSSGREAAPNAASILWVSSVEEAADYLKKELAFHPGSRALITTGSKELFRFAAVEQRREALYARVLPSVEGIEACEKIGLKGSHIIAMQGPFFYDMNLALLKAVGASYLVTKESGQAGGFSEKLQAALDLDCQVIVVGRPVKEEGMSFEEIKGWLEHKCLDTGYFEQNGLKKQKFEQKDSELQNMDLNRSEIGMHKQKTRTITLVGIGMGSISQITLEGIQAILDSDAILGASRMVECGRQVMERMSGKGRQTVEQMPGKRKQASEWTADRDSQAVFVTYRPEEMLSWLEAHPQLERPVILYSGDVGFYSGAEGLMKKIQEEERPFTCRLLPGISSMAAFAARIGRSWEKAEAVSFHGKQEIFDWTMADGRDRFFLLDGSEKLHSLCRRLIEEGQENAWIWVGERLSYPDETILSGKPEEMLRAKVGNLSAAWVVPWNGYPDDVPNP